MEYTMDKFHFNRGIDRKNTRCYKYDSADARGTEIGLWVADMDFEVAPAITAAIRKRAEHPVFGYVTVNEEYRLAVHDWYLHAHGWDIPTERIETVPGVVPAITAILRERAKTGAVCFFTPAYNCFFSSAEHAGAEAITSPLILRNQHYEIDWENLANCLERTKTLLLCNPHNPTGRVWTREELTRIAEMCAEKGVMVIADEIHCEFGWGRSYCPWAVVVRDAEGARNQEPGSWIVLNSASKAWNIAGLRQANAIAGDDDTHQWLCRVIEENELEDMNIFGVEATIAAYREGEEWLQAVNDYFRSNYEWLCDYLQKQAPQVKITKMEGTYLAWVDCRALPDNTEKITRRILEETGVKVNDGKIYGGEGFIRINLAITRSQLEEGIKRMLPYLQA